LQRWPRLVATGFILLILVEILVFVWVADHIGLGLTLLALLGSATLGLWLIRRTGLDMIGRLRLALAQGQEPGHSLVDGVCFVIAGMLLIVPGFFTDLLAIVFMLPWSRNWLIRRFAGAFGDPAVFRDSKAPAGRGRGRIITDVEFHEVVMEEEATAAAASPIDDEGAPEPRDPPQSPAGPTEIFVPARPERTAPSTARPNIIDVETEDMPAPDADQTEGEPHAQPEPDGDPRSQPSDRDDTPPKKDGKPGAEDWTPRRPIIDVEEN